MDQQIQINRKKNLKRIINEKFDGDIVKFAIYFEKNKFAVYSMLWSVENKNHRNVSDVFARYVEQKLNLEIYYLDSEIQMTEDHQNIIIPFVDGRLSNEQERIVLHSSDRLKLPKKLFEHIKFHSNLICWRIIDRENIPHYDINDIVIINTAKKNIDDNLRYLIKFKNKFLIRELSETSSNVSFSSLSSNITTLRTEIEIIGIVDFELKRCYYS